MNNEQANKYLAQVAPELNKTHRFIKALGDFDKSTSDVASFDSLNATQSTPIAPDVLQELLASDSFAEEQAKQAIFDGLRDGIEEYKMRNGGTNPPSEVVYSALL